ncbi:MAG: M24 family metallopeptidase [Thermoplasmatota archaeon]
MNARVSRVFANLKERVDAIVLMNGVEPNLDMSFFWLPDLVQGGLFERSSEIAWPDGRLEVLTTPLEEPLAKKARDATITIFSTQDEKKELLAERLKGARTIGINGDEATYSSIEQLRALFPSAKLVDVSPAIAAARVKKDKMEIDRTQKAADIASQVAKEIPSLVKGGMKEYELGAEIGFRMAKLGASGPSFSSIIAFGPNSAEGHYATSDAVLREGQYVLCDFGAYYHHYASDITRTWVYGRGKASKEQRDIYDTVLRAQKAAMDVMKPGAKGRDVHAAADRVIEQSPWKGKFTHGTGHSLGLSVHDSNTALLNGRSDLVLEEGMILTVEPGIYVAGMGGVRIEDDVLVTKDGIRVLTSAPRDFVELG